MRQLSQETKDKISASLKGRTKVISAEQRQKISQTMTGRKLSPEHRQHIIDSRKKQADKMRGRKMTPEQRQKVSEALKGHKLSEETRAKISATRKERYPAKKVTPAKKKYKAPKVKKVFLKQTEEERQRLIAINKANGVTWNKGVCWDKNMYEKAHLGKIAGAEKKRKYVEEYKKKYGEESLMPKPVKIEPVKEPEIIDDYYRTHLRPEEMELPISVIAKNRKITASEVQTLFMNTIKPRV